MRGLCRLASLSRSQSLTLTVLARSYPPLPDPPPRPLPFVLSKPLCALARCHPAALLWLLTLKTLQYTSQIVEPVLIAVLAVAFGPYEASVTQVAAIGNATWPMLRTAPVFGPRGVSITAEKGRSWPFST